MRAYNSKGHRVIHIRAANQRRIAWLHQRLGITSGFDGRFTGRWDGYKMSINYGRILAFVFTGGEK